MLPNINPETGIRYGTIYINELDPEVGHTLMFGTQAVDLTYQACVKELEAEIRRDLEVDGEVDEDEFQARFEREVDRITCDEPTIIGTYQGVKYQVTWLGGAPLLFVFESPYTGMFALCSPCVPNAVSLTQEGDYEGYDVPNDWRNEE